MMHAAEIRRIQQMVFGLVHFSYEGDITVQEGEGLCVQADRSRAMITAQSKPALARAFFRMAQELSSGKDTVHIQESPRFDSCGFFLDFSRNGVMTVEASCRYMDYCAALGMNLVVLYTEDTYTVPEYLQMGYLRGRLTEDELRRLDEYAASLGMELVPCIQTLGHMENFLQWRSNQHLKDQVAVLLADEEETYKFIEAEIRAVRRCIRGKRLHIGMDEAHGVGLGRYYAKHGPTDRFPLLSRHLDRVVKICEKYGFEPMMWSDMFFRLGSKNNEYYDKESCIPQSVIDSLPDVGMVYWDYYHTDESWYEHMLTEHEKMSGNTIFAGGVWTWSGFLPQVELTWNSMEPGLRCCARHQVKTVIATMWGDDGQETNQFLALSQVPIFSEFCWRGDQCDREAVMATAEFLTGLPRRAYEAFGLFYPGDEDNRTGKALVYCDLLYPLGPRREELADCIDRSRRALEILAGYREIPECRYAASLFRVCLKKALVIREMRPRYLAGDKEWLAKTARETIPELLAAYEKLRIRHKRLWERDYKRNGWEVLALRYGAVEGRLRDVQDALERYVRGELATLCELDEEPQDPARKSGTQFYNVFVSPVYSL